MKKLAIMLLFFVPLLRAQVSNPSIVPRATAPTTCTVLPLYVLTTNGDLYGDDGTGACKVLSTPTSALSGSGTATHLPIWTAGSTLGDSPATFASSLFTFPDALTVQAHSAGGVGSAVDSGAWQTDLGGPFSTINILQETSTTAAGINGLVVAPTWNPASAPAASYVIYGQGIDFNFNLDSQTATDVSTTGLKSFLISNGSTINAGTMRGADIETYEGGTSPFTNMFALSSYAGSNTSSALGGNVFGNYATAEHYGTGTVAQIVAEYEAALNDGGGVAGTMLGHSSNIVVSGGSNVTSDVDGYLSSYNQSSASANPTDYLGFIAEPVISAGSFSTGIIDFVADGENPITTTGLHAIPEFVGFNFESITAPAHVINNEYGVLIADVTQGDHNWAIKTGAGLVELDGTVLLGGITGHGTAGVVGIDTSGNLSAQAAPTISAANMTSFPAASNNAVSGSLTYTTATSDTATVTGATSSSHCAFSPTNATAAAITVLAYISSVTTNAVTITHVATTASTGTVSIVCTKN